MKQQLYTLALIVAIAAAPASFADSVSIEVTSDDTMRFNTAELSAPAGQEVVLTLKNLGKLPKEAMGHNLVILQPGSDIAAFANAAIAAKDNEYIPTDETHGAKIVAYTKMLGPGEEDTITVTFENPGSYPFLCSFPGHWALMKGVIEVE